MNVIKNYFRHCAPLCTITLLSHAVLFGNEEPVKEQPIYQLEDFVVSAGPVARSVDDFASPFSSLGFEEIQENSGSSIGELLEGQPGVSSTSFGSAASRPIIRGFDGVRVRILDSGIEALDVSSISVDHAVATEPLLLERIEILRGPSTLLYGSSAIGGVVNMIGREIPRSPVSKAGEVEGGFKSSYDSASSGETTLGYIKAGGENWSMSVTGLTRDNDDYEIPGHAELNPHEGEEADGKLENSFVETDSYSIGNTWFFNEGSYFGLSYSNYNSLYGVPGHAHEEEEEEEEAPTIVDLERKRFDAELVLIELLDWIKAARVRFGSTDYMHVESEGEHATRYDNEGWELRGEIAHDSFASFDQGVVGIQFADSDFSAIGEEAFTPDSNTQNQAIFISEHIHNGDLHWEFGARVENQTVNHSANPAERPDIDGSSYSDTALGLGVSAIWNFAENQSLTLSLQRSQRHPTSTELYALGAHIATDQYEIGDAALGLETAYGIDLRHNYSAGNWSTTVSAFYTTFDDYIYSRNLGTQTTITNDEVDSPHFGESVNYDNYRFEAVDALFYGFEAEANYIAYQSEGSTVTVGLLADYVRATNEEDNTNLPRITPMRIGGKLRIENGAWVVGALLRQNFKQSKNAEYESETASFTELQFDLSHSFQLEGGELTLFAQGRNLLDEDIRRHTSFIKDKAPLPGKSVNVGLSYKF